MQVIIDTHECDSMHAEKCDDAETPTSSASESSDLPVQRPPKTIPRIPLQFITPPTVRVSDFFPTSEFNGVSFEGIPIDVPKADDETSPP